VVVFAFRYRHARAVQLDRLARGDTVTGSTRTIDGVVGAEREVISLDATGLPKVGFGENGELPTLSREGEWSTRADESGRMDEAGRMNRTSRMNEREV
jgi:hypothetical protein